MDSQRLTSLLESVARGTLPVDQAAASIGSATADLGFARLDLHRQLRCGLPEAIFAAGKSVAECVAIAHELVARNARLFMTRVSDEQAAALRAAVPDAAWHERARVFCRDMLPVEPQGLVVVCAAGTSDLAVAEEAALTAEACGARVERRHDVGVAGLHRLEPVLPLLREASVVVAVAGMEGALPSVIAGLIDRPVIAVPTSVGYGTSFGGLAALLAMLNSCAAGVTVTNIDNGFGAGCAAARINHMLVRRGAHGN
jgi:NCAIR mutase (PurE)-related protein